MKSLLSALILILACVNLRADPLPQQPHVYVEGSAELEAEPDMMNFSLSIQAVDLDLARAKADVDARSRLLIAAAKRLGLSPRDLATSALNVRPEYDYRDNQRVLTGNNVSRQVDITLRDLKQYPDFMKVLVDAKISETINTSLTLSDKKALEDKAQQAAMADARARAERLASSQGKTLTGVWSISEFNTRGQERWQLVPSRQLLGQSAAAKGDVMAMRAGVEEPFEPGVMKLSAQVFVVYLLQ